MNENYEKKCSNSLMVYYDQGNKPKNILLSLVVFDIHVFDIHVQKKSTVMVKIHMRKWNGSTLMLLQSYL